jgi:hypothetical protein
MKTNLFSPPLPESDEEWEVAVNVANWLLAVSLARRYGLTNDDGTVNRGRCELILAKGDERGVKPRTLGPVEHAI